jgi:hypothetical protein
MDDQERADSLAFLDRTRQEFLSAVAGLTEE